MRVPAGQGVSRDLGNDVLRLCQFENNEPFEILILSYMYDFEGPAVVDLLEK